MGRAAGATAGKVVLIRLGDQRLRDQARARQDDAVDLDAFLAEVTELLAIESTADRSDELERALRFVVEYVGPGFSVDRFESNGRPSALIHSDGDRGPYRVILNAHMDVVPADPAQFRPRRVGDRLYARGAQDMKVTGLLQARAFREMAAALPYPLALQVVTDEELGGRDGTLHQLERGVTGEFVIIGEHSGLDVVADSKGLCHVTLRTRGEGGHSAYPWLGDNALVRLVNAVERVMARYPVPAAEEWRTTVNLARVHTPNRTFNQIPAEAEAWLDVRFPADDVDLYGRGAEEIAARFTVLCGPGVSVTVDHLDGPHHADHDRPEIAALRRAAGAQGFAGKLLRKHGAGDGRHYSQRGIDAVAFGIAGAGQHGPDEYADVTTIVPYYQALTQFLTDLAA
jgi:succinyl-diaminopimelate desuccinylase